jgi:CRISP-associated protein Cas1
LRFVEGFVESLRKMTMTAVQASTPSTDPRVRDSPDFASLSHYETLWQAWQRVLTNAGAAGGDGISVEAFAVGAESRVSRLSHLLREGTYRPGPTRHVEIPKRSSGTRPLHIPPVGDRIVQTSIAAVLQPRLDAEFEDSSFGYRPGRSVLGAVRRIMSHRRDGFSYVVDGDIVRYFEHVPHDRLLERLERAEVDARTIDLIALILECHNSSGSGLPQGSPLSPLLANLFLDDVDEAIEGRGIRLVRFADDFVILCKSEALARGALERMSQLLAERGLALHPEKTRVVPFDQGFRFLGHVFVRSMVWKEIDAEELPGENIVSAAELAIANAVSTSTLDPPEKTLPRGRFAPRQRLLHVLEPGRRLSARGQAFVVSQGEETMLELPHRRVDRIEVALGCEVAVSALDLAAATDTEVVRVDGTSAELGRWSGPTDAGRSVLHLAQAALILDSERRRALAQTIAAGRVGNQRAYLKRANRTRKDSEIAQLTVKLGRIHRKLALLPMTREAAMGQEGSAAALYWPALASSLAAPWAMSGRRTRRVGADPFNLVLDVLCNLVARDLRTAIVRNGLHPGFGVLHDAEDGADALVFDLIEEFRAPLVEATAVSLFTRRALTQSDFVARDEGGVGLARGTWPVIIRAWEAALTREVRDQTSGLMTNWRGIMSSQAAAYADHCRAGAPYKPYAMDY